MIDGRQRLATEVTIGEAASYRNLKTIMQIRPYADQDAVAARALFIQVNRELAPPEMREAFEGCIAIALREEIDRICKYYAGPRHGFWVAEDGHGQLLGTYGLEPAGEDAVELRRMYVALQARRRGVARAMLAHAEGIAAAWNSERLVLSTAAIQRAALALYQGAGYRLLREAVANAASNKTAGSGLQRLHFEKVLRSR